MLQLYVIGSATAETFFHQPDGSKYQVPTGKKFKVVYIILATGITTGVEGIVYADNEDGTTNAVMMASALSFHTPPFMYESIYAPAGKYINKNTATAGDTIQFYGIEEDA